MSTVWYFYGRNVLGRNVLGRNIRGRNVRLQPQHAIPARHRYTIPLPLLVKPPSCSPGPRLYPRATSACAFKSLLCDVQLYCWPGTCHGQQALQASRCDPSKFVLLLARRPDVLRTNLNLFWDFKRPLQCFTVSKGSWFLCVPWWVILFALARRTWRPFLPDKLERRARKFSSPIGRLLRPSASLLWLGAASSPEALIGPHSTRCHSNSSDWHFVQVFPRVLTRRWLSR